MTTRSRWMLVGAMVAGLLFAAGGWLVLRRTPASRVTFQVSNGGPAMNVLGVTHGTNHVQGHWLGRLTARTPSIGNLLERFFGPSLRVQRRSTAVPSVLVWLEPEAPSATGLPSGRSYVACLADETGTLSGREANPMFWILEVLSFEVVPRRMRELDLRFFERLADGTLTPVAQLRLPNPWFGTFPDGKTALPLPRTVTNGTLEATLEAFTTGHDRSSTTKSLPGGGTEVRWGIHPRGGDVTSVIQGRFITRGRPEERWVIASARMEDVTGNRLGCGGLGWTGINERRWFTVSPSLWPSEKSWRLELEMKRDAGIPAAEMFEVRSLALPPVGGTNMVALTTNIGGVRVVIESIARKAPITESSWSSSDLSELKLKHSPPPAGYHLDLMQIRADAETRDLDCPSRSSDGEGNRAYHIKDIPAEAHSITLIFALQEARRVTFDVRPEQGREPEK